MSINMEQHLLKFKEYSQAVLFCDSMAMVIIDEPIFQEI